MGNETKVEVKVGQSYENCGTRRWCEVLYSELSKEQDEMAVESVNEVLEKYATEKDVAGHLKCKFEAKFEVSQDFHARFHQFAHRTARFVWTDANVLSPFYATPFLLTGDVACYRWSVLRLLSHP